MEDKHISEQESLLLIRQMIDSAKREQRDDGKGWIIWGWMLFAASLLTVLNLHNKWVGTFFFWNIFGVLAIVLMLWELVNRNVLKRKERVRTYTKDLFNKLDAGFFISLMFIITSMNVGGISPLYGFPLLVNLYSFWILIYGSALDFKPSVIGAYISWAIGISSLFVGSFETVMLLHAAAVLCGYIIPGHIAYNEFRKVSVKHKSAEVV
jgi:hypothetical protein